MQELYNKVKNEKKELNRVSNDMAKLLSIEKQEVNQVQGKWQNILKTTRISIVAAVLLKAIFTKAFKVEA